MVNGMANGKTYLVITLELSVWVENHVRTIFSRYFPWRKTLTPNTNTTWLVCFDLKFQMAQLISPNEIETIRPGIPMLPTFRNQVQKIALQICNRHAAPSMWKKNIFKCLRKKGRISWFNINKESYLQNVLLTVIIYLFIYLQLFFCAISSFELSTPNEKTETKNWICSSA